MTIKIVGVVGAGTMGNGIAQVFAQAGFAVRLVDVAQPMLDRARGTIETSLAKFVEKGQLTAAERDATIGRLPTTTSLDGSPTPTTSSKRSSKHADTKRALFARLDALAKPRRHPRVQHVVDLHHACSARRPSGRTGCSACTS